MNRLLLRTWRSVGEHTYLSLVSTGVITAALLLLGLFALGLSNMRALAGTWAEDAHVSAYLSPTAAADAHLAIQQAIAGRPEVATVRYVSPAEARAWMEERMPDVAPVLTELGESALPASLEITLKPAFTAPDALAAFAASIEQGGSFAEVDYGQEWIARFDALLSLLTAAAVILGLFVGVATLFLVANTIHLVVYARRDELEIMRLIGATDGYILSPFLVEGAVQGLVAAVVAIVGLYVLHRGVALRLEEMVALALGGQRLEFLPVFWQVALLIGGVLVGTGAPWGAVRRFLRKLA